MTASCPVLMVNLGTLLDAASSRASPAVELVGVMEAHSLLPAAFVLIVSFGTINSSGFGIVFIVNLGIDVAEAKGCDVHAIETEDDDDVDELDSDAGDICEMMELLVPSSDVLIVSFGSGTCSDDFCRGGEGVEHADDVIEAGDFSKFPALEEQLLADNKLLWAADVELDCESDILIVSRGKIDAECGAPLPSSPLAERIVSLGTMCGSEVPMLLLACW